MDPHLTYFLLFNPFLFLPHRSAFTFSATSLQQKKKKKKPASLPCRIGIFGGGLDTASVSCRVDTGTSPILESPSITANSTYACQTSALHHNLFPI